MLTWAATKNLPALGPCDASARGGRAAVSTLCAAAWRWCKEVRSTPGAVMLGTLAGAKVDAGDRPGVPGPERLTWFVTPICVAGERGCQGTQSQSICSGLLPRCCNCGCSWLRGLAYQHEVPGA